MPNDEKNPQVEGPNFEHDAHSSTPLPVESPKKSDKSLLFYVVVAVGIAVFVRFFIAAPYLVDGPSMEETFHDNDYLIVDRLTYSLGLPERGDVVVFKVPTQSGQTLIKRIVGLPGETITVGAASVVIANADNPKGFTLDEPYISRENMGGAEGMTITLAPDHYFVMGDHRSVSYDSRSWGTLPGENIVGRVMVRLYPLSDIGFLPGEARYQ